jgi:hypothetical protein
MIGGKLVSHKLTINQKYAGIAPFNKGFLPSYSNILPY